MSNEQYSFLVVIFMLSNLYIIVLICILISEVEEMRFNAEAYKELFHSEKENIVEKDFSVNKEDETMTTGKEETTGDEQFNEEGED